jgi:hypothetical protein
MSIEDRIRTSLEAATQTADLPRGDVAEAVTRGRQVRRRRRGVTVGAAAAAVAIVAVAATLTGSDRGGPQPAPEPSAGTWTAAATSPLSPRHGPLMRWTGEEVLVIGGHSEAPCPPGADCEIPDDGLRDAAAYDPDADTWRTIAPPPVDMDRDTGAVISQGLLVVGGPVGAWWSYDPRSDRWERLPEPSAEGVTTMWHPGSMPGPSAALDGKVYATDGGRDVFVLDVASRTWTALPPDPLQPVLTDTRLFATEEGIVLTGVSYGEAAPDEPTLTRADVWDGTSWRRLPRTGMIGWFYYWTGERILGIEEGGADGGEVNGWGEYYPHGGALDPATGEWEPIPGLPADYSDEVARGVRVEAGDGPLVATNGRAYDDRTREWTNLGFPDSTVDYEQTATWAGERLVVFGGYGDGELSKEAWVWQAR